MVWNWGEKGIEFPNRERRDEASLARQIGEAVAEEREACARLTDSHAVGNTTGGLPCGAFYWDGYQVAVEAIARAIRARSKP